MELRCPLCEKPFPLDLGDLFDFHLEFSCFHCHGQLVFSSRVEGMQVMTTKDYAEKKRDTQKKEVIEETRDLLENATRHQSDIDDHPLPLNIRSVKEALGADQVAMASKDSVLGGIQKFLNPKSNTYKWGEALKIIRGLKEGAKELTVVKREVEFMVEFNHQAALQYGKQCQDLYVMAPRNEDRDRFQNQMVEYFKQASFEKGILDRVKAMTIKEFLEFSRIEN